MFIAFLALYLFLPRDFVKIDPLPHINRIREYATPVDFTIMQCAATSFLPRCIVTPEGLFKQTTFAVISKSFLISTDLKTLIRGECLC